MTMSPSRAERRAAFGPATGLFQALSDSARLTILWNLAIDERRVVDLTDQLGLAQSTVSAHLASLVGCGLVTSRAEGRSSVFALTQPEVTAELLRAAERLLEATGSAVSLCARYGDGAPGRHRA